MCRGVIVLVLVVSYQTVLTDFCFLGLSFSCPHVCSVRSKQVYASLCCISICALSVACDFLFVVGIYSALRYHTPGLSLLPTESVSHLLFTALLYYCLTVPRTLSLGTEYIQLAPHR